MQPKKETRTQHVRKTYPCGCTIESRDVVEMGNNPQTTDSQVVNEQVCDEARSLSYALGGARLEYARVANHATRSEDEEQMERVTKDLEEARVAVEDHYADTEPVTRVMRYE
jgi:hypothetical protein